MGDRQGRPDRHAALGQGRQAEDRGHRPAQQEADGDLRRRVRRWPPRTSSSAKTRTASRSSSGSTPRTCTLFTHTKPKSLGQAGRWQSPYHDTMIDHDKNVGEMLDLLDELGIAEDTIVVYSTDNGPHRNTWPDGGMTPFRSREEHQLGRRIPRAAARALARQDQGRVGRQRHRAASRLAADVPRDGG